MRSAPIYWQQFTEAMTHNAKVSGVNRPLEGIVVRHFRGFYGDRKEILMQPVPRPALHAAGHAVIAKADRDMVAILAARLGAKAVERNRKSSLCPLHFQHSGYAKIVRTGI